MAWQERRGIRQPFWRIAPEKTSVDYNMEITAEKTKQLTNDSSGISIGIVYSFTLCKLPWVPQIFSRV